MEWTRFFVAPDLQTQGSGRPSLAAAVVLCGMLEFSVQHKLRGISVVCEPSGQTASRRSAGRSNIWGRSFIVPTATSLPS
jgi:N-acyl-L-homoserine lactone synthetase